MEQRSIPTSTAPEVLIEQIQGNLEVKGWEQDEVSIKALPNTVTVESYEDVVRLSCSGSCIIYLPAGSTVKAETIHGDARMKQLEDQLSIEQIHGSLVLREVGETRVEMVHGNLSAKEVAGALHVERVLGSAQVRDVAAECLIQEVGGNLDARSINDSLTASVDGNARIRLNPLPGIDYTVEAGGTLTCRLPEDASAVLELASDAESILLKMPEGNQHLREATGQLTLGSGEANLRLKAGASLLIACQGIEDEGEAFFSEWDDLGESFSGVSKEISQQISRQMEAVQRQINEQMERLSLVMGKSGLPAEETEALIRRARETSERANAKAQEKMRRAQERLERKLEAARRREEKRSRNFDRRTQARSRSSWQMGGIPVPPSPPSPPDEGEPVTEEERLMILRMLEQKKISVEEAEKLLAALEGKEV